MSDTPDDEIMFHDGSIHRPRLNIKAKIAMLIHQRDAYKAQRDRLAEALDALTLVVGLTPIMGNKEALQEAFNNARAELAAVKQLTAASHE